MAAPDPRDDVIAGLRFLTETGWRRAAALVTLGAAAAAALPPWHWAVMFIPGFAGLLIAASTAARARDAFGAGWWFGVGHFAAGFYWVGSAFLVDAERYGFLAPFAVAGLAIGMAVFPGLAALIANRIIRWRDVSWAGRGLVFAAAWVFAEWLRGWVLTGFPWNLAGSVWTASPEMTQAAAYVGTYGLGLISVAAAAGFAGLAVRSGRRAAAWPVAAGVIVVALVWGAGHLRLQSPETGSVDGVRLRLVQPNIPQHLKWKSGLRAGHVRKQLEMSLRPPAAGPAPTHIIWAETSVPFNLSGDPPLRNALAEAVPAGGLLIAGAPQAEGASDGSERLSNSLHALDAGGRIVSTYAKRHLVPFGEYVPFRSILKFSKLTAGRLDFTPGSGPKTMALPGLPPALALICYEVIFAAEVGDYQTRPAWLLNVTNDAWFGNSAGPHQHLAAAQLRAAEQGLPLIRVANTGITAVIDAYGRRRAELPLGGEGVLDTDLPKAVAPPPYARFGDALTLLLAAVAVFVGGVMRRRELRNV